MTTNETRTAADCGEMTYDAWLQTFRPILNPVKGNAPFDGTMFETGGGELNYVRTVDTDRVWTLMSGDDDTLYIGAGFHLVNRLGYFVTEVARAEDCQIEILVD